MQGQQLDQGVLAGGERHVDAVAGDQAPGGVDRDVADLDHGVGHACAAANQRAEASEQLGESKRLDDIIIRAGVEPAHAVADTVAGGEDEHGGFSGLPQSSQNLEAVQAGEQQVEHDRLVFASLGFEEPFAAVGGLIGGVALFAKRLHQRLEQIGFVFDHEHAHGRAPLFIRSWYDSQSVVLLEHPHQARAGLTELDMGVEPDARR